MQALIDAGLLGGENNPVSLIEWEYRNQRLRLLFQVPPDKFDLGAFLAVLERQPMFKSVKLMPDTPALTVGVQAQVVEAPPVCEALLVGKTTNGTPLPSSVPATTNGVWVVQ